ncbi:zinc-binding alcohol dehydrogenase family protein [Rhizobium lentis]|uniref:zinc-binding alcohol dehydrogenase family protein n=1 Tax=Rhizobium TaxID=379 RepID=UPI001C83E700|nr:MULTISPECIES: zinc-binding alcohol dehydrogenase family protein [Rhizobium]MBX5132378.1 zinc-binding alcohol dehydrogenase family protein [Rhizobium lentis]MBX5213667.1 zinc-binding alcohol dehydrogenase family protein [Rhizobium sp. NLR9a]MBX5219178.1 zinc-binding alcohol dehydrogenase family protein [Rhizobium sp. NLR8a]MBX5275057.1 zinc-binding alcohol dehydrogenase family protein [Rhizobium sp. NLR13a]MBX5281256.1 zinc-binding alcohol dehydrogenase family protein [Rhizobium sp. NLR10a]
MKAIGYTSAGSAEVLTEFEVNDPFPGPRDLVVSVKAVSVNPVDTKVRKRSEPEEGQSKIIGYDAAGVVVATGEDVSLFKVGDEVFYAGSIDRQGSNAELQAVDERIVGCRPKTLSFAESAALPLTALTAWELLFERLRVPYGKKSISGSILIINGAGGVGSILIQLARRLTGLTVIATASRPETVEWVRKLGAHHVVNHREPLDRAIRQLGIQTVDYVAGLTDTDKHLGEIVEIIAPQGSLSLIDDIHLDIGSLKPKSVSVTWEMVFTRPVFQTEDMIMQHGILNEIADLVDAGVLQTTAVHHVGEVSVLNLQKAHKLIETGKTIGKIVLG